MVWWGRNDENIVGRAFWGIVFVVDNAHNTCYTTDMWGVLVFSNMEVYGGIWRYNCLVMVGWCLYGLLLANTWGMIIIHNLGWYPVNKPGNETSLVGGFKHLLCSILFHNIWDNNPNWLSYFSRWLKPPTRSTFLGGTGWTIFPRPNGRRCGWSSHWARWGPSACCWPTRCWCAWCWAVGLFGEGDWLIPKVNVAELPSGKRLHNYGKTHHF